MRFTSAPRTRDLLAAALAAASLIPATSVHAQVSWTGNVDPSDPTTWGVLTEGYIGDTGTGTLTIGPGGIIDNWNSYIGYAPGAEGTVTVTGAGSVWDPRELYVGYSGTGTLVVESGGVLDGTTYIGYEAGAVGHATIRGSGSLFDSTVLYVGHSGEGTLVVESGAVHEGSLTYLGYEAGAVGHATVRGIGSVLDGSTTVGEAGAATLLVESGGVVTGFVTLGSEAGGTGSVTVRGAGSQINGGVNVGRQGIGTLLVEQGGAINGSGSISAGSTATITGTGSSWTTSGSIYLGSSGGGGELLVESGATMTTSQGVGIGMSSGATSKATIRGTGSQWDIATDLRVGWSGNGALYIEDSGVVNVSGQTEIPLFTSASGSIHLDNGTLNTSGLFLSSLNDLHGTGTVNTRTLMADIDLVFDASNGLVQSRTINSQPGQNVSLNIDLSSPVDNTGTFGVGNRGVGTLRIADGRVVEAGQGYLGYESSSDGAATITGSGSRWVATYIDVGRRGAGSLLIEEGGVLESGSGGIGIFADSVGSVTVTGPGSRWDNAGRLTVGFSGAATLAIENGGVVDVTGTTWLGANGTIDLDNGTLNTAGLGVDLDALTGTGTINTRTVVSDFDLVFDATDGLMQTMTLNALPGQNVTLNIDASSPADNTGDLGAGNVGTGTLRIADGQQLQSARGYLGYQAGSNGTATVTGPGSQWTTTSSMHVGYEGVGELRIENGGVVNNAWARIGWSDGGSGTAHVEGVGSQWNVTNTLYVGERASGTLIISSGGVVNTNRFSIADSWDSSGSVTVTGPGSQLNAGFAELGSDGPATLVIEQGGVFNSAFSVIGDRDYNPDFGDPPSPVAVTVTGAGSQWNSSANIEMWGPSSTMTIEDGGVITSSAGIALGELTIRGTGSQWNTTYGLSTGGQFRIESGGAVNSSGGSASGSATVTGVGSQWNSAGGLSFFGSETEAGAVRVEDGGVINAGFTEIGVNPFGSFEPTGPVVATVTGAGSQWNATGALVVQTETTQLNILSGAVFNSNGGFSSPYFGSYIDEGAQVLVSGVGSQWTDTGSVFVGNKGAGTLVVEAGAVVNADRIQVGGKDRLNRDGVGVLTVSGVGSQLNTATSLILGAEWNGMGTLIVEDGAAVNTSDLFIGISGIGTLNIAGGSVIVSNDLDMQGQFGGGASALNLTLTSVAGPLIEVGGNADLAGTLSVGLNAGTTLTHGDNFTLIGIVGTQTGTFDNHAQDDQLGLFNNVGLFLDYAGGDGNDVVAYTVQGGDLNFDDKVEFSDFNTLANNYNGPSTGQTWSTGDFTGDGDVSFADFNVLANNFGFDANALVASASIQSAYAASADFASVAVGEAKLIVGLDGSLTIEGTNVDLNGFSIRSASGQLITDADADGDNNDNPFQFDLANDTSEVSAGIIGSTVHLDGLLALDAAIAGDVNLNDLVFEYGTSAGTIQGVVEVVPEPTSLALLGLGGLLLARRRRWLVYQQPS